MSRTLFGYVARLYLVLFAGALGGVLTIFLVADFGDRLRAFLNHSLADIALVYALKLVVAAHQLAPAAMLLSAGAASSILRRRGEWTAMQAVGASRWAVVAPIASCALAVAVALVAFDELAVTRAGTKLDLVLAERFDSWGDYRFYYAPKQWFRVGNDIVQVRGEAERDGTVKDVTVFHLDRDFRITSRIDAELMRPVADGQWRLEGVAERTFPRDGSSPRIELQHRELSLTGTTASTFSVRTGRPELMRLRDLIRQQRIRAGVGLPIGRFRLAMHNRFAYPMTGLAAALLAVTLGLRRSRQGPLTLALVEGLLVAAVLFGATVVGRTLVLSEHVPAWLAAWGPSTAVLLAAALLWRYDEGKLGRAYASPSARR